MNQVTAKPTDRRRTKAARTRLGILNAAIELAQETPLVDVQVDEIADRADVSRMTFFNHFGQKDALWMFFAWTWWLKGTIRLIREPVRGRAGIERIFADVAEFDRGQRRFFLDFIAFVSRMESPEPLRTATQLTPEERSLLHPRVPGIEEMQILSTEQLLRQHVAEAIEDGELPSDVDIDHLIVDLGSMLYGGILMAHVTKDSELLAIYKRQLDQVLGTQGD